MDSVAQFAAYGPTVVLVLIVGGLVLKALPTWKEIKLREFELREKEIDQRRDASITIGKLTEVFEKASETTDELKIFMRSAAAERDEIRQRLTEIETKVDSIDRRTQGNHNAKIA